MLASSDHTFTHPFTRVLERYPKNGKLLKCYGRFLEDVRNDFKGASRTYVEAIRQVIRKHGPQHWTAWGVGLIWMINSNFIGPAGWIW